MKINKSYYVFKDNEYYGMYKNLRDAENRVKYLLKNKFPKEEIKNVKLTQKQRIISDDSI